MKIMKLLMWGILVMVITFPSTILAGGFNLKQIGEINTDGKQIRHWWYTGGQPIFRGEAVPGSEITINIDGNSQIINADSSGGFNYQAPSVLSSGDHEVTLTSGGSTIAFTLTIGNENVDWEAVDKGSGEALPAAGWPLPTFLLLLPGLTLPWLSKRLWK